MPFKDKEAQKEYNQKYAEKNSTKAVDRASKWNKDNQDRRKINSMNHSWKKIGIKDFTYTDYEDLLVKQDFKCKICNTHQLDLKKTLSVDHDHETGKARGLLCQRCNSVLGMAKDNIEILKSAIQYLGEK